MTGEFTGRHMAVLIATGFGIVVAVNLVMAGLATSTFGGVVVDNSYAASQKFNAWLGQAERDRRLGWDVGVVRSASDRIVVSIAGVQGEAVISAIARHPLGQSPARYVRFENAGSGRFVSMDSLPKGRWTLRLDVHAAGEHWRGERAVR